MGNAHSTNAKEPNTTTTTWSYEDLFYLLPLCRIPSGYNSSNKEATFIACPPFPEMARQLENEWELVPYCLVWRCIPTAPWCSPLKSSMGFGMKSFVE